jgi:putative Holliday junction resolvase
MRYLAIDPGQKRTGLAVGDDVTGHAGPVDVVRTSDAGELLRALGAAIQEHGPDALVVGVPYNADGSVGPAAKKALALIQLLRQSTGLPVHPMDERLTTFQADELLKQSGLTHQQKKERRDAIAAAAILKDFLSRGGAG